MNKKPEEKKNPTVNTPQLEEAFGVDLKEFEDGKTYPLLTLMDKLALAHGTPRLRRGRQPKENIFEKETAEANI
jgi:hypothetical protein